MAAFNDNDNDNDNESFTNIKKRVEHFNNVTPTPTHICRTNSYYYWGDEDSENRCEALNNCQFTYSSNDITDEHGCIRQQFVPFNTNSPDNNEQIWIDVQDRLQPLNYIPACAASSNYSSNFVIIGTTSGITYNSCIHTYKKC